MLLAFALHLFRHHTLENYLLTEGKLRDLHVVPVHHCDNRTSPATPPTGAPWNAIQSTVTLALDFLSLNPAAMTQAVNRS